MTFLLYAAGNDLSSAVPLGDISSGVPCLFVPTNQQTRPGLRFRLQSWFVHSFSAEETWEEVCRFSKGRGASEEETTQRNTRRWWRIGR